MRVSVRYSRHNIICSFEYLWLIALNIVLNFFSYLHIFFSTRHPTDKMEPAYYRHGDNSGHNLSGGYYGQGNIE